MPVPLIPYSHYAPLMDIAIKLADQQIEETELVGLLIPHLMNLPKPHLKLLLFLLKFLADMSQHAALTKMDTANLAIVFATNIMKPEEETMDTTLKYNHVNNLLKLMIEKCDEISRLLPSDEESKYDNWLQDLLKNTRSTPIYVEDKPNPGPTNPPENIPAKPATEATTRSRNTSDADPKRKKDRSAKASLWSKEKK